MFCLCLVPLHYQHISNLYTVCIDTNSLRGRWIDVGCQEKVWWLKLGTIHYSDSGYSPEEAHSLIDSRRYELEEHRKWFMDMPHASFITRARHFSLHLMKKKKRKIKKKKEVLVLTWAQNLFESSIVSLTNVVLWIRNIGFSNQFAVLSYLIEML